LSTAERAMSDYVIAAVEKAYRTICFGNQEPDQLFCSQATAKVIFAAVLPPHSVTMPVGPVDSIESYGELSFNHAKFVRDDNMPFGEVKLVNGGMQRTQRRRVEYTIRLGRGEDVIIDHAS
jgi:hypothetical protein